jgi:hypothetical protein
VEMRSMGRRRCVVDRGGGGIGTRCGRAQCSDRQWRSDRHPSGSGVDPFKVDLARRGEYPALDVSTLSGLYSSLDGEQHGEQHGE